METLLILYILLNVFLKIWWIVLELKEFKNHICLHSFPWKLHHKSDKVKNKKLKKKKYLWINWYQILHKIIWKSTCCICYSWIKFCMNRTNNCSVIFYFLLKNDNFFISFFPFKEKGFYLNFSKFWKKKSETLRVY